jgi:poly(3-hydroxybutyrate) depolymerase
MREHLMPVLRMHGLVAVAMEHDDRDSSAGFRLQDAVRSATAHRGEGRRHIVRGAGRKTRMDAGGKLMAEHWTVHGSGHAWSGGSKRGSYTDPKGPDASREMLRFFAEAGKQPGS